MNECIKFINENKRKISSAYSSLMRFRDTVNLDYIIHLNLYSYVLWRWEGKSLCEYLEKETNSLWLFDQYSNYKYGVFYSRQDDDYKFVDKYENEEVAFESIRLFFQLNIESSTRPNSRFDTSVLLNEDIPYPFQNKIIYLFHPTRMMPIYSWTILSKIIKELGDLDLPNKENLVTKNIGLTSFLLQKFWLSMLYAKNPEKTIIGLYFYLEYTYNLSSLANSLDFIDKPFQLWIFLSKDNWDDFTFKTTYRVNINEWFTKEYLSLGDTRIIGNNPDIKKTEEYNIKFPFQYIWDTFCSYSNNTRYYITLKEVLWKNLADNLLRRLNDIILKEEDFIIQFRELEVFNVSLLRDQFNKPNYLAECREVYRNADKKKDEYSIKWYCRLKEEIHYSNSKNERLIIDFDFIENKFWFYRIHAIIWKNGVGKTTTLHNLAKLLVKSNEYQNSEKDSDIPNEDSNILFLATTKDWLREDSSSYIKDNFSSIIWISYEVFWNNYKWLFSFLHWSKNWYACNTEPLKDKIERLNNEKSNFFKEKVKDAFEIEDINEIDIAEIFEKPELSEKLSSGYKVLLSTIIDIVMHIKPNSLILFDEPETHLHPAFVSNLINILYALLDEFKSYMVIGTHSPVIIQQIPARYITKIVDNGDRIIAKSLDIQSFWNSLTEIIYDVFWGEQEEVFYKKKILELKASWISIEELYEFLWGKLPLNVKIFIDTLYNE